MRVKEVVDGVAGSRRVVVDREVVVHIERSDVGCVDLLELPGLRNHPPDDEAASTRLVEQHVSSRRDMSLFVCVVEMDQRLNTAKILKLVPGLDNDVSINYDGGVEVADTTSLDQNIYLFLNSSEF